MRLILAALLAAPALLSIACGGGDSPEDSVTAFYDAVEATESDEACSHLTEEAQGDSGILNALFGITYAESSCETTVDGIIPSDRDNIATYQIGSTQEPVEGSSITQVEVDFEVEAVVVSLEESDGEWLISDAAFGSIDESETDE